MNVSLGEKSEFLNLKSAAVLQIFVAIKDETTKKYSNT